MIELPSAVIFDTDNTLYPYEPAHQAATKAVEEKVENHLGIKKDRFSIIFNNSKKEIKQLLGNTASSHSRLLYIQRTLENLGMKTKVLLTLDLEQTYWRTFLNNCKLFPGVLDFIYLLKSEGILMANITDLTAQIQFRKLVYFGLDEYFDYVVTSEEAGKDKPSNKPFELSLKKLQISPSKIWMIGDNSLNDMVGAERMGINKIQKKHEGVKIITKGEGKPNLIFENYSELKTIIENKSNYRALPT